MVAMIALDGGDNNLRARIVEIVFKPPAFAESGFFVRKEVVSVEHIYNGITLFRFTVALRKVNVSGALIFTCERGNCNGKSLNHSNKISRTAGAMRSAD